MRELDRGDADRKLVGKMKSLTEPRRRSR